MCKVVQKSAIEREVKEERNLLRKHTEETISHRLPKIKNGFEKNKDTFSSSLFLRKNMFFERKHPAEMLVSFISMWRICQHTQQKMTSAGEKIFEKSICKPEYTLPSLKFSIYVSFAYKSYLV